MVNSSATATLSTVGLLLLVLTGLLAYLTIKRTPDETPWGLRFALYGTLIGGMLFSAAGPGLALFWVSQTPLQRVTTQTAFVNLENNERVLWLIRLIPYNKAEEPQLAVDKVANLGPGKQLFSFVSAYEELVGYSAKDAVEMSGLTYSQAQNVSAIIFPLRRQQLYPANARGLLQVIREVEYRKDIDTPKPFLRGQGLLNPDEEKELKGINVEDYRVNNFYEKYPHYCELAARFRCDQKSSFRLRLHRRDK